MRHWLPLVVFVAVAMALPSRCPAQNVSGYGLMPDPFLFLLREPAVLDDLGLTGDQRRHLVEINHSFDGPLLATQNMPLEKGQAKIAEVTTETRRQITKLFSGQQQDRMRQIGYRLRGISCVLEPHAVQQLQLNPQQKEQIESIVRRTRKTVNGLRSGTFQGREAHQKSQNAITAAGKKEQQDILGQLDDNQKKRLVVMLGRSFDPGRLGHVSFKAPELSHGDEWINSDPLQLAGLRGKVVVLHFWTFG